MFNEKIQSTFASIKGKSFFHNDEKVYVEELIGSDSNPIVMLSNDESMSLFEAISMVEAGSSSTGSVQEISEQGHGNRPTNFSSQGSKLNNNDSFFNQGVTYDENGIPRISNLAQSEHEMEEVMERTGNSGGNIILSLLERAKKRNIKVSIEIDCDVIASGMYDILCDSYEKTEVDAIIAGSITDQVTEKLKDQIIANLSRIMAAE